MPSSNRCRKGLRCARGGGESRSIRANSAILAPAGTSSIRSLAAGLGVSHETIREVPIFNNESWHLSHLWQRQSHCLLLYWSSKRVFCLIPSPCHCRRSCCDEAITHASQEFLLIVSGRLPD